jgi:hypothetical protein
MVTATVTDGPHTATRSFTWTVTPETVAPVVAITSPTGAATHATSGTTLALTGAASDNVGVTEVGWTNSRGGSGVATGTTSWSVAAVALQSGVNVLTVTARDAAGNTATALLTVTRNAAPVLAPVADQVSEEGQPVSLQLSASDGDGDMLTFGAMGLPPGVGVVVSTGLITGTPADAGVYPVSVTVSDGLLTATQSFTWTVTAETAAPVVAITSPTSALTWTTAGATLVLAGTASDNVGVTDVSWTNSRGGSGVATGTTSWSVAAVTLQSGTNVLTVTARDAAGNMATDVLAVTMNTAPTLAAVSNQSSVQGLATMLQLGGSDADGDALTYGATGLPAGLSINASTGLIIGTPSAAGTFAVASTVTDGLQTATRSFTWTVTEETVAPEVAITAPTSAASWTATGTTMTLAGTASDNVGVTEVSWTNSRGGSGVASGATSWAISGIVLQTGTNVLTVTARDAAGNAAIDTLTVTYDGSGPLRVQSLTSSHPAPQRVGTTVAFTAQAAGGTGPYQYQWHVYDGRRWRAVTAWTSSSQFSWRPGRANSRYQIRVVVRGTGDATAAATMPFPIVR